MLFLEKHEAIDFLSHDPIIFLSHDPIILLCTWNIKELLALDVDEPQIGTIAIDSSLFTATICHPVSKTTRRISNSLPY